MNFETAFSHLLNKNIGEGLRYKNYQELADQAKVAPSFVSMLRNGKIVKADVTKLERLSIALGKDCFYLENLFYGRNKKDEPSPTLSVDHTVNTASTRKVPVFNVAAGGFLFDGTADSYPAGISDEYYMAETTDPGACYLKVHGDSMIGANIRDGDLLLAEPSKEPKSGDIVICNRNGNGLTVKKLLVQKDHIVLQPMNPDYEPIIISQKEAQDCRFIRVTEIKRKV